MYRVRILLLGLLALFVSPSLLFATGTKVPDSTGVDRCWILMVKTITYYTTSKYPWANLTTDLSGKSVMVTGDRPASYPSYSVEVSWYTWVSGAWTAGYNFPSGLAKYSGVVTPAVYNALIALADITDFPDNVYPSGPGDGFCEQPTCDDSDDDSDGVCNSCDSNPGLPDKKHCIWSSAYTVDGKLAYRQIDQSGNCDGSSLVNYKNSAFDDQTQYFSVASSGGEMQLDPPTCQGDDGSGSCKCGYPADDGLVPADMSETTDQPTELQADAAKKEFEDCGEFKSACDGVCLKYGGAKTNSCSVTNGKIYGSCVCKDLQSYHASSDSSPSTDTSNNGDVAATGGTDTNNDGKSDTYAAVKDAIKDSGLTSKIDSTNTQLNSIGNALNTTNGNINALGSKVDGLGTSINGMGNSLGSKLDSINSKLGNGFDVVGTAALPGSNNYDPLVAELVETPLFDTIGQYIASGLPLLDYFRGTYITITSSSPVLSTQIFGKTVSIDFSGTENVLNDMGLVLVAVATILAFMIIVHKG